MRRNRFWKMISVILERANQLDVSYAQVMFEMMLEAQKTNKTKIDPVHHLQEAVTLLQQLPASCDTAACWSCYKHATS